MVIEKVYPFLTNSLDAVNLCADESHSHQKPYSFMRSD